VFKGRELIKAKGIEDWQQEEHLQDSFIKTIRQLQHSKAEKQHATSMRVHYKVIRLIA
jgi:hypothetical protein